MSFALIKNNFKIMLRNKPILIVMAVLPIIIIALLSSIFDDLLSDGYSADSFVCGYQIEEGSDYKDFKDHLSDVFDENKITIKDYDYSYSDYKSGFHDNEFDVFVKIGKDNYTIYRDENKAVEASVAEYIFSSYFDNYNINSKIMAEQAVKGVQEFKENSIAINNSKIDSDKVPDSVDYYGMIYVIFFSWCTPIVAAFVINSERANKITKRFNMSPMSSLSLYMGKLISSVLAGIVLTAISMSISTLIFNIHWGNYLNTIGILLLQIVACNALGIVIFYLFNNNAVSIAVMWLLYMFCGFIGGTFTAYMYSGISDSVRKYSPIYLENRTLVEFSTKGASEYADKCVIYLIGIIIVCTLLGMPLMNKRMESET